MSAKLTWKKTNIWKEYAAQYERESFGALGTIRRDVLTFYVAPFESAKKLGEIFEQPTDEGLWQVILHTDYDAPLMPPKTECMGIFRSKTRAMNYCKKYLNLV